MAAEAQTTKDDYQFNVLVVDDDAGILSLLRDIMSMVPGCNVRTATAPAAAMEEIVKGAIDIVFTDVHMPGVTGFEMIRDIIALEKSPQVVVMTAYPSPEAAQQAMELGAMSLISKPFDDIAIVEVELEKAIKKIMRQRAAQKDLQKAAAKTKEEPVPSNLVSAPAAPAPDAAPSPSSAVLGTNSPVEQGTRNLYNLQILEALVQIESERCKRYNRQFALGYIDMPENFQISTQDEQAQYRRQQILKIENCIRRSDVLLDGGRDGIILLAYECSRLGIQVVENKLAASGFHFSGFSVFPVDAQACPQLLEAARRNLLSKRKLQILVFEQEEFFGRLIQNMLSDPKYEVTWTRTPDETYQIVNRKTEQLKLFILSLTKETTQWELLAKFIGENLVHWPVLLFVDIALKKELREKIRSFGVRGVVNKGISQEEFLYIVQSFVLPRRNREERKNFRALVTLPITYQFEDRRISSNTFTLSRDGLFIRDLNPPPTGSIINLEIFIPGAKEPLKTRAEVLYVVPYFVGVSRFHVAGMAAKFLDIPNPQKDDLESLVMTSRTSYIL